MRPKTIFRKRIPKSILENHSFTKVAITGLGYTLKSMIGQFANMRYIQAKYV